MYELVIRVIDLILLTKLSVVWPGGHSGFFLNKKETKGSSHFCGQCPATVTTIESSVIRCTVEGAAF